MKINRKLLLVLNAASLALAATLIVMEVRILTAPGQVSLEYCMQCSAPIQKSSLNRTI